MARGPEPMDDFSDHIVHLSSKKESGTLERTGFLGPKGILPQTASGRQGCLFP
jgi:hypothetical protein